MVVDCRNNYKKKNGWCWCLLVRAFGLQSCVLLFVVFCCIKLIIVYNLFSPVALGDERVGLFAVFGL